MARAAKINLKVLQGSTFNHVFRWGVGVVFKSITAASKAAPVVLGVAAHGLPALWPIVIADVLGMTELNADTPSPGRDYRGSDYVMATTVDADHLKLASVDGKSFSTYTSGGSIRYASPVDLDNYTARMQVRATQDSDTVLCELTTENGGITLDNTTKTITLAITAEDTADFDFEDAVYDLEMVLGDTVTRIIEGEFDVSLEVTR